MMALPREISLHEVHRHRDYRRWSCRLDGRRHARARGRGCGPDRSTSGISARLSRRKTRRPRADRALSQDQPRRSRDSGRDARHGELDWTLRLPLDRRPIEQYGIMYHQLVNAIRAEIPPGVEAYSQKALSISTSAERQTVALSNGEVISARLVVLATGLNVGLRHTIGVERRIISACHSISIGRGRLRRLTVFARCRSTKDCTGGPSARRALWSGLPKACCGACATGSTRSRNFALNPRHHRRRCRRRPDRPPGVAYGSDRPRASGTRRWRRAVPHASRARSPCRPISR
jgi:hypothetical protein